MTGGGKTYTILGTPNAPGILPRTLSSIFSLLPNNNTSSSNSKYIVSVTYVEIYNEGVYDLLSTMGNTTTTKGNNRNNNNSQQLKITNDKEGRIFVAGARQITVPSKEAAMLVLAEGSRNKTHQETALNADSSRSHSVFSISIWKSDSADNISSSTTDMNAPIIQDIIGNKGDIAPGYSLWSRLSIVDLAGSERADRTGTVGIQTKEAGKINNSLMFLMQCLETMRENARLRAIGKENNVKPVPIRNSKLTYMFGDYLGGSTSGSTVMIVNAGPGAADYDETLQAVKYGAVVKDVKVTKDRVNTRWEPGQYGLDGRRVNNKRKAENEVDQTTATTATVDAKNGAGNKKGANQNKSSTMNSNKAVLSSTGTSNLSATLKSTSSSNSLGSMNSLSPSKRARMTDGFEDDDEFLHSNIDEPNEARGSSILPAEAAAELSRISEELARTREEKQAMEARVLTLETQIVEIQDEMRHLELTKNQLEEEIEEAHDLAASIEDDTRNEMAAAMDEELRNKDNFWQAKLAKEKAEAKETITKIHDLMKLHSKRAGSKRGSSISGLLKDLIGLPVASTTTTTTTKQNRRATAEYSNRHMITGTNHEDNDEEEDDDDLEDEEEVGEYHEVYEQRIQELETKLSSTLTELSEAKNELEIMRAEVSEIEATYAAKVEELEAKIEELREQVGAAEQDAIDKSRAAVEASMAAADAAEATAEARDAANVAKDRANIAETVAADLRTALANAEANIVTLRSTITIKDNELESLRNSLSEAREDHAAVEEELITLKNNMETLTNDHNKTKQQHDQLAGAIESYKEKLAEKDGKINFFINAIETMESKTAKDTEEIASLRTSLSTLQQSSTTSTSSVPTSNTNSSEVLSLRTEVTSLRTALAQNAIEISNAREQVAESTSRLLATQAAHTALSKELEVVTAAKDMAVNTAQTLQTEMDVLRSTVAELENRLRVTQVTLDDTNAALENAKLLQQQQTNTPTSTMLTSSTQTTIIETKDHDMNTDAMEVTTTLVSSKPRSRFSEFLNITNMESATTEEPTVIATNETFDAQPAVEEDDTEVAVANVKPKRGSKGSRASRATSSNGGGRRSRAPSTNPTEINMMIEPGTENAMKVEEIGTLPSIETVSTTVTTIDTTTNATKGSKVQKGQGSKDDATNKGSGKSTTTSQTAVMARLASPLRSPNGRMMLSPNGLSAGVGPRTKVGKASNAVSNIIQRSTATTASSTSVSKQTQPKPTDLIGSPMMEAPKTMENKIPTNTKTTTTKTTAIKTTSKVMDENENIPNPTRTPIATRLRTRK